MKNALNFTDVAKCFEVVSVKNKEVKSKLNHFFTQEQTSSMLTLFFTLKFQIYKKLQPQKKILTICIPKTSKNVKTKETKKKQKNIKNAKNHKKCKYTKRKKHRV